MAIEMNKTEVAIIVATLCGPILAIQAQKWIERATESRRRKQWIFETLMATRATRLSPEHVRALNQIELDFSGTTHFPALEWSRGNGFAGFPAPRQTTFARNARYRIPENPVRYVTGKHEALLMNGFKAQCERRLAEIADKIDWEFEIERQSLLINLEEIEAEERFERDEPEPTHH